MNDTHQRENNSISTKRNVKTSQDILTTLLTEMQKGTAGKLKVEVGQEFKVAFEEGNKYGAQICLFDRPVGMTLSRFWSSLRTRFEKFFVHTADGIGVYCYQLDAKFVFERPH